MATIHDSERWALVTGSARRIGRAIALELAAHGWDIIVHYHRSADEAQQLANKFKIWGAAPASPKSICPMPALPNI